MDPTWRKVNRVEVKVAVHFKTAKMTIVKTSKKLNHSESLPPLFFGGVVRNQEETSSPRPPPSCSPSARAACRPQVERTLVINLHPLSLLLHCLSFLVLSLPASAPNGAPCSTGAGWAKATMLPGARSQIAGEHTQGKAMGCTRKGSGKRIGQKRIRGEAVVHSAGASEGEVEGGWGSCNVY